MKILKNTFPKNERLCGEKEIENLYAHGFSFLIHPLVVYVLKDEANQFSRVLVSVSKKKFKKAVHRNLLKRRMREAYRLNKSILSGSFQLAVVYVNNQLLPFQQIEKSMIEALRRVAQEPNLPRADRSTTPT